MVRNVRPVRELQRELLLNASTYIRASGAQQTQVVSWDSKDSKHQQIASWCTNHERVVDLYITNRAIRVAKKDRSSKIQRASHYISLGAAFQPVSWDCGRQAPVNTKWTPRDFRLVLSYPHRIDVSWYQITLVCARPACTHLHKGELSFTNSAEEEFKQNKVPWRFPWSDKSSAGAILNLG